MKWLRPLFIVNLVFIVLWLPILPMLLMMMGDGVPMVAALCAGLFYTAASVWLVLCGKKSRTTVIIVGFMACALSLIVITASIASNKRADADCAHFQTECAKLDGQAGLFHCGGAKGFITIAHVEEKCLPSKEQSCAYAKQFCRLISPPDSALTHYACSHNDTIACP